MPTDLSFSVFNLWITKSWKQSYSSQCRFKSLARPRARALLRSTVLREGGCGFHSQGPASALPSRHLGGTRTGWRYAVPGPSGLAQPTSSPRSPSSDAARQASAALSGKEVPGDDPALGRLGTGEPLGSREESVGCRPAAAPRTWALFTIPERVPTSSAGLHPTLIQRLPRPRGSLRALLSRQSRG